MEWNLSVKLYVQLVVNCSEIPEEDRPKDCPNCNQSHQLIYRHGQSPLRTLITLEETYMIPIFRFFCPVKGCRKAFSIIPDFVEKYHAFAIEVKEEIIHQNEEGVSFATMAGTSVDDLPASCSESTLWRWKCQWDERLHRCQPELWEWLLPRLPHFELPKGKDSPRSDWKWFFHLWKRLQEQLPAYKDLRFLHFLSRLSQSNAVTVVVYSSHNQ